MRMILASLLVSLVAACGGSSKPAPAEPVPDPAATCDLTGENGTPATAPECECAGYTVVGDIGDGQVACPDGTTEVSRIQYGIEGGVCCTKPQGGDAAQTGPGPGGTAAP